MDAIEFYSELLKSTGLSQQTGSLGWFSPGSSEPITVNGKTLMLPTKDILKIPNVTEEVQLFHPASEDSLAADSEVLNFLRRLYRISLSLDLQQLMISILKMANNQEGHPSLNVEQNALLARLQDNPDKQSKPFPIDEKLVQHLEQIISKNDINGENKFLDLTVTRGETIDKVKYNRVTYIHLPFYEEIVNGKGNLYGVKIREKDRSVYRNLMEIIFDKDYFGEDLSEFRILEKSNAKTAPSFVCLTKAYEKLKRQLINIREVFGDKFPPLAGQNEVPNWRFDPSDIDLYRKLIPISSGNIGKQDKPESTSAREEPTNRFTETRETKPVSVSARAISLEKDSALDRPMTYAELKELSRKMEEQERNRPVGRFSREDSDDRFRNRRGVSDIDVSDIDPDAIHQRQERERHRTSYYRDNGYTSRDRDRYGRRKPRSRSALGY